VEQRFPSDSDELEGCVQTSKKPERSRKGASKTAKKVVRVGITKNK